MTSQRRPRHSSRLAKRQLGVTLVDLMVGMAIGLLTIAASMGTLMISRSISSTVSEASQMQQQAAYAFRVIGQQLRQAGSQQLRLPVNTDPAAAVVFGKPKINIISGIDNPADDQFALTVRYQNYQEATINTPAGESLFRDCLGQQSSNTEITSQFTLQNKNLRCAGSDNNSQAILQNVANFQVRYLVQTGALRGQPLIQTMNAEDTLAMLPAPPVPASNWSRVFGVEVCVELFGSEIIDTAGALYTSCNGDKVDRANRLRLVFRNVYQLRSQGLSS